MESVLNTLKEGKAKLREHQLFKNWLLDDQVPLEKKFIFSPMAIDFIMGFRDLNKYYYNYETNPVPCAEEEQILQKCITIHSLEDETHSPLFIEDWKKLNIDSTVLLNWRPRDLLWFMTDTATEKGRRANDHITELATKHTHPLERFCMIETMEAAGKIFFKITTPLATLYDQQVRNLQNEEELRYYGKYHLDRETGHLQGNGIDESLFTSMQITEQQAKICKQLIKEVFAVFELHFTEWYHFAKSTLQQITLSNFNSIATRSITLNYQNTNNQIHKMNLSAQQYLELERKQALYSPVTDSPSYTWTFKLLQEYQSKYQQLSIHPYYQWLHTDSKLSYVSKARVLFMDWIVDVWNCGDFYTMNTPYPSETMNLTPLQRGINRLSKLFASELQSRYQEWQLLQMDEQFLENCTETLQHYWLHPTIDVHRKAFHELKKLVFAFSPTENREEGVVYRFWIMKCFAGFANLFMQALKGAYLKSINEKEEETYRLKDKLFALVGMPELLHPNLSEDVEADEAIQNVLQQPITQKQYECISKIISATYEQEKWRVDSSWKNVEAKL